MLANTINITPILSIKSNTESLANLAKRKTHQH